MEKSCCVCKAETTGAHECYICKNPVHAICASKFTEVDEGYGSKVTCRNCEGDEPPVKRPQLGL